MRDIENPFVEEVLKSFSKSQTIIVKIKDKKMSSLYKFDILMIMGVAMVMVVIIVLSIFAFSRRPQSDKTIRSITKENDAILIQKLKSLEENSIILSEKIDSLDFHIRKGINNLHDDVINLHKSANERREQK